MRPNRKSLPLFIVALRLKLPENSVGLTLDLFRAVTYRKGIYISYVLLYKCTPPKKECLLTKPFTAALCFTLEREYMLLFMESHGIGNLAHGIFCSVNKDLASSWEIRLRSITSRRFLAENQIINSILAWRYS